MNHYLTPKFTKIFEKLEVPVQELVNEKLELLKNDLKHPSLQFKKIRTKKNLYSARMGDDYRILGCKEEDNMIWFWIGMHNDYEKKIKTL